MGYFYKIFPCHGIFLQNIPLPWDIFTEYSPTMGYFYRIFPCHGIFLQNIFPAVGYHFYSILISQSNRHSSDQGRIIIDVPTDDWTANFAIIYGNDYDVKFHLMPYLPTRNRETHPVSFRSHIPCPSVGNQCSKISGILFCS